MDNQQQLARLERALKNHPDADIKNLERLRSVKHSHTAAMCKAITSLLVAFNDRKIVILVEVEISALGKKSRPEDFVAWVEDVGIFVLEIKSHTIEGIRRFENNVPQVVYKGKETADTDITDQPRDFAYDLKGQLEKVFSKSDLDLPPLYYAGWLPNVSPEDVAARSESVALDKVWLSDMLQREVFEARLPMMKNISKGTQTKRSSLEPFCKLFGSTSGLRQSYTSRPVDIGTMGHLIDRKNLQLKKLTKEQEDLAFSENLVRGPKVIRGVAGSGKTVVLANAVAEAFLRAMSKSLPLELYSESAEANIPRILVLCYNRVLAPYLGKLIYSCFESRKPESEWIYPRASLEVINIDLYAYRLAQKVGAAYSVEDVSKTVESILKKDLSNIEQYQHIFIDEGQDFDLEWYPLIQKLASDDEELGKSIIVFYDEAQNLYGKKKPGDGDTPPWKNYLGSIPNPRGLSTIMRVGHRNTNQILSFSFNLLLGSFADQNPQMMEFAGISGYEKEKIPEHPSLDHPNAGKFCVERIDERQFKVNFAVDSGPPPVTYRCISEKDMLSGLIKEIESAISPKHENVEPSDVLIMVPYKEHILEITKALSSGGIAVHDPTQKRDEGFAQIGKVTISTIKSAKGHTAHVCHVVYVHDLKIDDVSKERMQENRAQLHVACTRSSLYLHLWGKSCSLMSEAEKARAALGNC
jgi:hypothetical protein